MRRPIAMLAVLLCLLAVLPAAWADPDFHWVELLGGVHAGKSLYQNGQLDLHYMVDDAVTILPRFKKGLRQKGWKIEVPADAAASDPNHVTATYGNYVLHATLAATDAGNMLRLEVVRHSEFGQQKATTVTSSGTREFTVNRATQSIAAGSGPIIINGTYNHFLIEGGCPTLDIRGSYNEITCDGAVDDLIIEGDHNHFHIQGAVRHSTVTGTYNDVRTEGAIGSVDDNGRHNKFKQH